MRDIGSRNKTCLVPVALVAGLSVAGMGLLSESVVMASDSVTDTINVTVTPSCTFNSAVDKTYTGSAANGAEVENFTDSGVHSFNLFCNNHSGFTVSATNHDLAATGITPKITYTNSYSPSGTDSQWTAVIASSSTGVTVTSPAPVGTGTIISSSTNTGASGVTFTATYFAYVGTAMPAGTYTGTIEYTLAPSGSQNSGNGSGTQGGSGSGTGANTDNNNGGNGGNSGSEEPTEQTPNPVDTNSGDSTQGTSQTNGTNSLNPSSLMMSPSNTYSTTYNTYNTYNTTNYQNSGSSAPTIGKAAATPETNEESSSSSTSSNGSGSNTDSSYEKPLGVTTTKSSTTEKSTGSVDPMPVLLAGGLALSGVVAVVVIANGNKEKENKEEKN